MPEFVLYDAEKLPTFGMFPTLEHSRIPPGGWKRLVNVRLWRGGVTVRNGSDSPWQKLVTFKDAILADAPVLYYSMNVATATDESPNGLNGTVTGSPQTGQPGGILYETSNSWLFAPGQSISTPNNSLMNMTFGGVLCVLIKPSSLQNATVLSKGASYSISIASGGVLTAQMSIGGVVKTLQTSYEANKWQCVVLSYDGSRLALSVNGDLRASTGATGAVDNNSSALSIAGSFAGHIGGVAILKSTRFVPESGAYLSAIPQKGWKCLGLCAEDVDGENAVYVAYHVGPWTEVYRLDEDGSHQKITTQNNGSGIDTRLGTRGPRPVSFAVVMDPGDKKRRLFITDGGGAVRFWDGATTWRHERVPKPRFAPYAFLTSHRFWKVSDPGGTAMAITNSDSSRMQITTLLANGSAANPGDFIRCTIKKNVANGNNSSIRVALPPSRPAIDAIGRDQLWIVLRVDNALGWGWLDDVKIEVGDGATSPQWSTVHDIRQANTGISSRLIPIGTGEKYNVLVCSLEHIEDTKKDDLQHLRITWAGPTQTGTAGQDLYVFDILAVCAGGFVPGFARYAVSHYSKAMLSQGPPIVQERENRTAPVDLIGGYNWLIDLPESQFMLYDAEVQVTQPSQASWDHLVRSYRLYRRDIGEEDFYQVGEGDYEAPDVRLGLVDRTPRLAKNFDRPMPSELSHGIPVCSFLKTIGARLWAVGAVGGADPQPVTSVSVGATTTLVVNYVGGLSKGDYVELYGFSGQYAPLNGRHKILSVTDLATQPRIEIGYDSTGWGAYPGGGKLSAVNSESIVMFSRHGNPMEFSPDVFILPSGNVDDDSPGQHEFASERPVAVAGTSSAGIDAITLWTDRQVYVTGGTLTRHLLKLALRANNGLATPHAFAQYITALYWVDQRSYVYRTMGGGPGTISGQVLDGILDGATASMAYHRELIYLCAKDKTADKWAVFVWDDRQNAWVQDEYPVPITMVAASDTSADMLLGAGEDGKIRRLARQDLTQDDGNPIEMRLESRRYSPFGLANTGVVMRTLMAMGPCTGQITIDKIGFPNGTAQGTITLSPTDALVRYEKNVPDASLLPAVECNGVIFNIRGQIVGSPHIMGIYAEIEPRPRQSGTG